MTATKKMWNRRIKETIMGVDPTGVTKGVRNFIVDPPHPLKTIAVLLVISGILLLLPFPTLEMYCKLLVPSLIAFSLYHKGVMMVHNERDADLYVFWYVVVTPLSIGILVMLFEFGLAREAPKAVILNQKDNVCYVEKMKHHLTTTKRFHALIEDHFLVMRACNDNLADYRELLNLNENTIVDESKNEGGK